MKLERLRLPRLFERGEDTEGLEENFTTPNAGLKDQSKKLRCQSKMALRSTY